MVQIHIREFIWAPFCPSQAKALGAWLSVGIIGYCIDNSLLSSVHIKYGDCAFSLFADDSGEPVNLESIIHIVF